jgi:hypothetical protein
MNKNYFEKVAVSYKIKYTLTISPLNSTALHTQ